MVSPSECSVSDAHYKELVTEIGMGSQRVGHD